MLVAAGLSIIAALAQEQYALQMKFAAGEQWPTHITVTGVGMLTVAGPGGPNQSSDLWMNAEIDLSQEVKSVDERGTAEIATRLEAVDAEMQFMGMRQNIVVTDGQFQIMVNDQIVFDSLDPDQAKENPMVAFLGQAFILKQDTTGKIVGLPQIELMLKMMMPDSDLKTAIEQSTGPLPPGPVKLGDTWEERQVWPYAVPEGTERPVFVTRHTFAELADMAGHQCAKIASASNLNIADVATSMPMLMMGGGGAQGPGQMSIVLNKMTMDLTGTQYFDIERGLSLKADATLTLNMAMQQKIKLPEQPPQPQPEGEQDAEAPEMPREIDIAVSIEDLIIDIAVEVGQ